MTIKSILVAILLAICSLYFFERVLGMVTTDLSFFILRKLRNLLELSSESSETIKSIYLGLNNIFIRIEQYLTSLLAGIIIGQIFKENWLRLLTLTIFFAAYFYFGMSLTFLSETGIFWSQLTAIVLIVSFGVSGIFISGIQGNKTRTI